MGWQVALSEAAGADLEAVVAFIAKRSPTAAERIGLELVDLIFTLDQLASRRVRFAVALPRPVGHRFSPMKAQLKCEMTTRISAWGVAAMKGRGYRRPDGFPGA